MRVCRDCLKQYRRRNKGARKPWPDYVYHSGSGRCCPKHAGDRAAQAAVQAGKRSLRAVHWADKQAIREVYREAAKRRAAGENVHVDHVVPLLGEKVSGLHVASNLQIIPAADNIRKGNKYPMGR